VGLRKASSHPTRPEPLRGSTRSAIPLDFARAECTEWVDTSPRSARAPAPHTRGRRPPVRSRRAARRRAVVGRRRPQDRRRRRRTPRPRPRPPHALPPLLRRRLPRGDRRLVRRGRPVAPPATPVRRREGRPRVGRHPRPRLDDPPAPPPPHRPAGRAPALDRERAARRVPRLAPAGGGRGEVPAHGQLRLQAAVRVLAGRPAGGVPEGRAVRRPARRPGFRGERGASAPRAE